MPPAPAEAAPPQPTRLASIDILRGLAIALMALDHCRDYFAPFPHQPEELAHASPALFFTRWITHFCAPTFVFLAGTSIYLRQYAGPAAPGRPGMSRFLLTRALWLIFLECTLIGASWGFLFVGIVTLQVIWAIGVSMLAMALLVRMPWQSSLLVGAAMVILHNILDRVTVEDFAARGFLDLSPAWMVLHEQGFIPFTGGDGPVQPGVFVVYPLIPWIGVMALGYAFGRVMHMPRAGRTRWCLALGASSVAAFIALRLGGLYGDSSMPAPGEPRVLAVLNATKYPPSLHFLLMTLGPALLALPLFEWLACRQIAAFLGPLRTLGRVPLFFYLLHIPLIHASSAILWFALYGVMTGWQVDPGSWPEGYTPRLWVAYAAWAGVLITLYFPCRWFAALRERRRDWWLSYL